MKDNLLLLFGLIVLGLIGAVILHNLNGEHHPVPVAVIKVEPEVFIEPVKVEPVKAPETVKEPEVGSICPK